MKNTSKNISTPWGAAHSVATLTNDGTIIKVSTSEHGGYGVSRNLKMPEHFIKQAIAESDYYWFEEDLAWACVPVAFPEKFNTETLEDAKKTMLNWLPDVYAAAFGVVPTADQSYKVRERELNVRLANNYRPRTGYGDWAWNTPLNHCYVVGHRESDGSSVGFLVPEEEYRNFDTLVLDNYPEWQPDKSYPYSKAAGYKKTEKEKIEAEIQ